METMTGRGRDEPDDVVAGADAGAVLSLPPEVSLPPVSTGGSSSGGAVVDIPLLSLPQFPEQSMLVHSPKTYGLSATLLQSNDNLPSGQTAQLQVREAS